MVESVADHLEKLIHAVCNAADILNSFLQSHIWSPVNEWGHCEDYDDRRRILAENCQNNLEVYT